jgi:exopolysaccharide production protein ExoQ
MNPIIATLIYVCGIAGLFYLDRNTSVRTSRALWLPVIYLWITGSRSVSDWLGISPSGSTNIQLEGSPLDAAVLGLLLVCSIGVIIFRWRKARILLAANWPILIYFVYCLASVSWSEHPDVAFKRWIKSIIDVAMAMIVVTDGQPVVAFRRMVSRVGFVLLPLSLLYIKYYPNLGRSSSPSGEMENTGVTTNKNILGVVLLVICLGTLWHLVILLRDRAGRKSKRRLVAQGVLLAFGVFLLRTAHSATSIACFMLGGGLILATNHRAFRGKPARVQLLCLALVLVGAVTFLLTGQDDVANVLGRDSTLSGRTEIWSVLIPTVSNSMFGTGFESYWISPSAQKAWSTLSQLGWWHPEILVPEAHNGYIEVYLNLGWIGLSLIATILITGFRRAIAAVKRYPSFAGLLVAYVMVSIVYSITEAGFRMLDPIWFYLLLAIVSSNAVLTGIIRPEIASARSGLRKPTAEMLVSLAVAESVQSR